MTYFTASELRAAAGGITASAAEGILTKSARTSQDSFDVFLSHSVKDAVAVVGLKGWLEDLGFSVYVDWIVDHDLDRSNVSTATARTIRSRMGQSRSLVYATSRAASTSRWMPWELGYFDGTKGQPQVAICPIETGSSGRFVGEEYLKLYKVLEKLYYDDEPTPFVTRNNTREAQTFGSFVRGSEAFANVRQN